MPAAAIDAGPRSIAPADRPDSVVAAPTDAVVRVVLSCVCGSDLWYYRRQTDYTPGSAIGHEFVGVVEQVTHREGAGHDCPGVVYAGTGAAGQGPGATGARHQFGPLG